MPTDQKLALAPRGAIAGVDDGTNFWCFYTTDTNGVYQFRVDAKGAITKPQQVQLDDTPIPRSPLSGVVVKHGKQTKIVLFYLLRHGDVNLFATTLTATTPSATDSWDSSSSVCLNPKPTYPITGIQAGISGQAVPMRYESDTWYPGQTPEHLIQNSLFLHALKKFQARDPAQKLSFFQIGGIHGMPYKPWDEDTKPVTPEEGYCTHDSILFPTWHRPYVMLFEQALYEIMVGEIIPKLPQTQQKAWTDAASTWRLPYWDWAQKKVRQGNDTAIYDIPLIAKEPRIGVYDEKDGVSVIYIDNPMYKFVMPGNKAMGLYGVTDVKDIVKKVQIDIPFEQSVGTSRWAAYEAEGSKISTDWVDGKVDNTKITQALNNHAWYGGLSAIDNVPLAEMVYRLYIKDYISNYTQFATTKYKTSSKYDPDAPSAFLNLEYVHNNIHNWTGGFGGSFTGHMAEVPVAGFDPIFFFHHCNVDRLFALWQDVNQLSDKNWFDKEDDQLTDDGNWSNKEHELDTPLTYLSPFHRDTKSTYFTSDDVRDFKKYGYTYPELQPWLAKYKDGQGNFDVNAYINDVEDQIRNLYSPENASDVGKAQGFTSLGFEKWTKDIIVNITYDRFAFGGVPFTIYLFVGDPSTLGDDDSPLHAKAQLVGYVYTFSNPALPQQNQRGCQACQRKLNEGSKSRAQVPITGALVARLASGHPQLPTGIPPLANLESHSVENYLEKNLHWKVVSHGGHELDIPEDNPFIHVSVYHREARFDDVTNAAQYQHLPTATGSKPGGFIH
ncbi:common central domain of tyrosinase-domain-containing protein [Poronia punctata]|nr:common central domain of tyrosinase-domain-containing protein [Poronia punctata]